MKFFFDNNLSENLVKGFKAFGEDVVHLKDIFPEGTPDIKWLKYVGVNQLILVTRDERLRFNPAEIITLKQYKVGAFFLGGKNLTRCKIIQQIVRHWHRIKEFADNTQQPFIFRIPPSGKKFRKFPV